MNIFMLDYDPEKAAEAHCDKHVVKMILEYAQLMSSAHRILDNNEDERLYKVTHKNHPSAVWLRESDANYNYVYSLFYYLCKEYTHRYGKTHLTETKLIDLLETPPNNIPQRSMTPVALAMPDKCKTDDPVEAYRRYYKEFKSGLATWKTKQPDWW